ncbi:MAG: magnesium transporter [Methanomassiliicoccales archaeon]
MKAAGAVRGFFSHNRSVFRMGIGALTISSVTSLLAGLTLAFMTETLELLPGLMVLIPAAIGMRGAIFGAVGSRLGTSLHLGTFELSLRRGSVLRQNLQSSLLLTMFISFIMGFMAKTISEAMGVNSISIAEFIFISMIGGLLAGGVLIFINLGVAYAGFRRNWDIDNISAPLITAAGDVVTLPMLFLVALGVIGAGEMGMGATIEIVSIGLALITVMLAIHSIRITDREVRTTLRESIPILVLCILLDIFAGVAVEGRLERMVTFPALLVLVPPFLEAANALGGILTSRMGSQLHLGLMEPSKIPGKKALENFGILFIFSLYAFALVGVVIHLASTAMGFRSPGLLDLTLLSVVGGMLTASVLTLISYYVAVYTFRFSLNPDSLSIPLTSSSIDLVGAAILMALIVAMGLG